MVRVTLKQIDAICDKLENKTQELTELLRYYFSFDYNIPVFSQFFFPEHIKGVVPDFHREFYEILQRKGNDALAAPRNHAKSTTVGLIYNIWCVVNRTEQYIVYVSQNHAKTVQFITPLRWEFKTNELLQFVYGDIAPSSAKDDMMKDREDCIDYWEDRMGVIKVVLNGHRDDMNQSRTKLEMAENMKPRRKHLKLVLEMKLRYQRECVEFMHTKDLIALHREVLSDLYGL